MDVELKELSSTVLPVGTMVEVLNRFIPQWSRGFQVVSADEGGYVVRRLSDARIIPTAFRAWEVRPVGRV